MADLFGRKKDMFHNETGSSFTRGNSMSRPSGKTIYQQRQEYTQSMIKQQQEFEHRVEHLLTSYVDGKEICNVENCIDRLKMMDAQGQVWGQDMLLQVKNHKLMLADIEAEEELDCYPLECIHQCSAVLDSCIYNSILAIGVKENSPRQTSIILFQCEQIGAEMIKNKLEKIIEEWKGEQQNHDLLRNNLENMLHQQRQASVNGQLPHVFQGKMPGRPMQQDHINSPSEIPWQKQHASSTDYNGEVEQTFGQQRRGEPALEDPSFQMMEDPERNAEILNHLLQDIELFAGRLQPTSGSLNDNKKKKKTKKKNKQSGTLVPKQEYIHCFQKIKYSFNLLGKLEHTMQQPSAPEIICLLFSTFSTIMSTCPWAGLVASVTSPLLIPEAIDLLKHSLMTAEQATWKELGDAWNLTRAQHPNGQSIPTYQPTFSDGWVPPPPRRRENIDLGKARYESQDTFSDRASDPPQLMKAMYEFNARNSMELTVRKGDLLEVLDKRKQWWLARSATGDKGYIPNNILMPVDQMAPMGNNTERVARGFSDLQSSSTPAEVTAWLRLKGLSKITVKSLGILNGRQLLSMSQEELKMVCPEEGRRVFAMLSAVKSTLEDGF